MHGKFNCITVKFDKTHIYYINTYLNMKGPNKQFELEKKFQIKESGENKSLCSYRAQINENSADHSCFYRMYLSN